MEKSFCSPVSLKDFVEKHKQQDSETSWQLENSKTLEISLNNESIFIKKGAMIAYYGNFKFERTMGTKDVTKILKGFFSGEGIPLTQARGKGRLYVADTAKHICLIRLDNEAININGSDILAFEESLQWDIEINKDLASIAALGLFTLKLSGTGIVAFTAHGQPLVLPVSLDNLLYTDPNATVCWSANLKRTIRKDITLKTLIGRASGETYQLSFIGDGFVVVQPYEENFVAINR